MLRIRRRHRHPHPARNSRSALLSDSRDTLWQGDGDAFEESLESPSPAWAGQRRPYL